MKKPLLIIFLSVGALLPSLSFADITISATAATSSNNITIVSNSGGDGYLFANPDKTVSNFYSAGSCATSGTYQCNATRSLTNGTTVTRPFSSSDTDTSLQLTDGNYTIFSRASHSECYTSGKVRADCVAVSTTDQYKNFQICSDGSCLSSPAAPIRRRTDPAPMLIAFSDPLKAILSTLLFHLASL